MKTPIAFIALGLTSIAGWGQGLVNFQNGGNGIVFPTPADRCVYFKAVGGEKLVGTNYAAGLWFVRGNDLASVDARISPDRGRQATGPNFRFRSPTSSLPGIWVALTGTSQDYLATNGTVTFASGENVKRISVTLTADGPPEPDETFSVRLSNPVNGLLGKALGICTITEVRIAALRLDAAISFNTVPNRRYAVERSINQSDWEPVLDATNVPGTGGLVTVFDRGAGCQAFRVYRARLVEE